MLLLALGGEACKANTAVLELGRPLGEPRRAGELITQAQSKCHSNICRAVCNCSRRGFQREGQGWKAVWGAEGSYVGRWNHFVVFPLHEPVSFCFIVRGVGLGLAVPHIDKLYLRKANANLWGLILEGEKRLYTLLHSLSKSFYFVFIVIL